jgi:4-hydroxybenzoate polyprenyltransferase
MPGFLAYAQFSGRWVSPAVILLAICWTAAMHLFSAIPDIAPDKKASIQTTAVFFGKMKSLFVCFLLWLGFAGLLLYTDWAFPWNTLGFLYPLICFWVYMNPEKTEQVYWCFPRINSFVGFLAALYLLI